MHLLNNLHITLYLRILYLFTIFQFVSFNLVAQEIDKTYIIGKLVISSKDESDPDHFHENVIEEIIFDQINYLLEKRGFEKKQKNDLLKLTAKEQAEYMALAENDDIIRDDKTNKTTGDRIESFGGSRYGKELTSKNSIKKGKIPYTYAKIADDIVFRWFKSSKKVSLFEGYEHNLIGISVKLDERKRKVYTSVVLGNYKSFNEGPKYASNLQIPYTNKTNGLKPNDPIFCKRVNRHKGLINLQKGLYIEDNAIYFETDDLRSLKKLIGKKKDGLAVDILQKEQFNCTCPNIVDHNLFNQGVLTKRIYSKKLFKNNLANSDKNPKGFKAQLAILPEGISDNYELNLVIIKNKSVCQTVPQSFLIKTSGTYTRKVKLLADTVTINSKFAYKPIADSMQLSLKIPFENKKYTYETADIEPFLKLLNEPSFLIYNLQITAYSSIEGTNKENIILQQKRAESITKALNDRQANMIETKIITAYNWDDFKKDIQNTQHNIMASMSMEEAQAYIRDYKINKELEPVLKNHRYAKINMKVTFDISGENERPYVLKKFHNAISEDNRIMALSIQKYIMKKVLNYQYKPDVLSQLQIPNEKKYAGMAMNKLWVQYYTKQIPKNDFIASVDKLNKLNSSNKYIAFNDLFLKITTNPFATPNEVSNLQTRVDRLYYTHLRKETVDGLNIKLQFKIINYADSVVHNNKLKEECIDRIKNIVDIRDETLQNSLKLAELFIENEDYPFALKTLEPWVFHPNANEELLYAYVSLCSRYNMRMHTQRFNYAMNRSRELNPRRFCELFNGDKFSFKIFENQIIKDSYCKYCKTDDKMVLE